MSLHLLKWVQSVSSKFLANSCSKVIYFPGKDKLGQMTGGADYHGSEFGCVVE